MRFSIVDLMDLRNLCFLFIYLKIDLDKIIILIKDNQ